MNKNDKSKNIDKNDNYLIFYHCPECNHKWNELWSCACNSECPNCNLKEIEPYYFEKILIDL